MDAVFGSLKAQFNGKIRFITLNWNDKAAKSAIDEFSLDEPPASVLADADGRVVEKFEGAMSAGEMTARLNALLKNR